MRIRFIRKRVENLLKYILLFAVVLHLYIFTFTSAPVGDLVEDFVQFGQNWYQDEPRLIAYLRSHVLVAPDGLPYNLDDDVDENFSTISIEPILEILFSKKLNGVFVEAGAFNGEDSSNTLYLEKSFSWSGLLVEPVPSYVNSIKQKHRKAWLAPTCISTDRYPSKITFREAGQMSYVINREKVEAIPKILRCQDGEHYELSDGTDDLSIQIFSKNRNCTSQLPEYQIQCFPLYSLLLAANIRKIDFLNLDIEGNEIPVLRTFPFDKIPVKVVYTEVDKLKDPQEMVHLMNSYGFLHIQTLASKNLTELFPGDMFFVNRQNLDLVNRI